VHFSIKILLLQLMWAYAAASCPVLHLAHAAAARAAALARLLLTVTNTSVAAAFCFAALRHSRHASGASVTMCLKCVSSAILFNLLLLMWAYAAASCPMPHLTHAAAASCMTSCVFKYIVELLVSCCACCFAVTETYVLLPVAPLFFYHHLQLMWAYAAASCPVPHLTHAAAARAAELARCQAFSSSRQPLALLGSFRALGLSSSQADRLLAAEVQRLKQQEAAAAM
jgi:hypothetical protein